MYSNFTPQQLKEIELREQKLKEDISKLVGTVIRDAITGVLKGFGNNIDRHIERKNSNLWHFYTKDMQDIALSCDAVKENVMKKVMNFYQGEKTQKIMFFSSHIKDILESMGARVDDDFLLSPKTHGDHGVLEWLRGIGATVEGSYKRPGAVIRIQIEDTKTL